MTTASWKPAGAIRSASFLFFFWLDGAGWICAKQWFLKLIERGRGRPFGSSRRPTNNPPSPLLPPCHAHANSKHQQASVRLCFARLVCCACGIDQSASEKETASERAACSIKQVAPSCLSSAVKTSTSRCVVRCGCSIRSNRACEVVLALELSSDCVFRSLQTSQHNKQQQRQTRKQERKSKLELCPPFLSSTTEACARATVLTDSAQTSRLAP